MNCTSAQSHIFAARDTAPGAAEAAALADHVASCGECRALQESLTTATARLREADTTLRIPDAQREWHAVRRRIRTTDTDKAPAFSWVPNLRKLAPVTLVAVIALVAWFNLKAPGDNPAAMDLEPTLASIDTATDWGALEDHFISSARAEFVETYDEFASPFIFVDEESGWLVVWATDTPDEASI